MGLSGNPYIALCPSSAISCSTCHLPDAELGRLHPSLHLKLCTHLLEGESLSMCLLAGLTSISIYCCGCNKSAGCFAACSSPFWVAQGRLNYFNCSYPVTIQEAVPCVQAAVELRSALTAMKTENLILS